MPRAKTCPINSYLIPEIAFTTTSRSGLKGVLNPIFAIRVSPLIYAQKSLHSYYRCRWGAYILLRTQSQTLDIYSGGASGNEVNIPPIPLFLSDGSKNHSPVVSCTFHKNNPIRDKQTLLFPETGKLSAFKLINSTELWFYHCFASNINAT